MARQRRGGFRPPELRGTLGTLLSTALQQAGVVRDALERGARQGRSRLDEVRGHRRRQESLAELGEIVLDLIRRGEIDVTELPEAEDVVRHLDELDAEEPGRDDRDGHDRDDIAQAPVRGRFDERPATPRARGERDDGTVSSKRWSPQPPATPSRVWRPPADDEPATAAAPSRRMTLPKDPHRQGGIAFDDDDDLADYMHPDDLPPKPSPGGDS